MTFTTYIGENVRQNALESCHPANFHTSWPLSAPFSPLPWLCRCASPELCLVQEEGLLVNPCKRIGVVAECVSNCLEPQQYQWEARLVDGTVLPYNPLHYPNGNTADW